MRLYLYACISSSGRCTQYTTAEFVAFPVIPEPEDRYMLVRQNGALGLQRPDSR